MVRKHLLLYSETFSASVDDNFKAQYTWNSSSTTIFAYQWFCKNTEGGIPAFFIPFSVAQPVSLPRQYGSERSMTEFSRVLYRDLSHPQQQRWLVIWQRPLGSDSQNNAIGRDLTCFKVILKGQIRFNFAFMRRNETRRSTSLQNSNWWNNKYSALFQAKEIIYVLQLESKNMIYLYLNTFHFPISNALFLHLFRLNIFNNYFAALPTTRKSNYSAVSDAGRPWPRGCVAGIWIE